MRLLANKHDDIDSKSSEELGQWRHLPTTSTSCSSGSRFGREFPL